MKKRTNMLLAVTGAVLAIMLPTSAVAGVNLVQNNSFETGDFNGWTQFGNTGFTGVQGNFSGVNPTDGSYQAYFGPVGSPGGISQTLASASGNYDVSFDLYNFGGTPSYFDASLGAKDLINLTSSGAFGYTTYTFDNVAAGIDPTLTFTFEQNPSYFLLDNVSVSSATPEPGFYAALFIGLAGLLFVRVRSTKRLS